MAAEAPAPTKFGILFLHEYGDFEPSASWTTLRQLFAARFTPKAPGATCCPVGGALKNQAREAFYPASTSRPGGSTEPLEFPALDIQWAFPKAGRRELSIQGGAMMVAWFDLHDWPVCVGADEDKDVILEACERVHAEIDALKTKHGITPEHILVAGFGQGAAVALQATFRYKDPLFACACLSGWLTFGEDYKRGFPKSKTAPLLPAPPKPRYEGEELPPYLPIRHENAKTPVFWGHGIFDDVVLPTLFDAGVKRLREAGVPVAAMHYKIKHGTHLHEIDDLAAFVAMAWHQKRAARRSPSSVSSSEGGAGQHGVPTSSGAAAPPRPPSQQAASQQRGTAPSAAPAPPPTVESAKPTTTTAAAAPAAAAAQPAAVPMDVSSETPPAPGASGDAGPPGSGGSSA